MYANPLDPEVCLIFGLGLYFLMHPNIEGNFVFATTDDSRSQTTRFTKILKRVLTSKAKAKQLMRELGYTVADIASHSERKVRTAVNYA